MRALALATTATLLAMPSVAAGQVLSFPEPTAPAPRAVQEKSPSEDFRRAKPGVIGTFRVGLGMSVRVTESDEEGRAAFALSHRGRIAPGFRADLLLVEETRRSASARPDDRGGVEARRAD